MIIDTQKLTVAIENLAKHSKADGVTQVSLPNTVMIGIVTLQIDGPIFGFCLVLFVYNLLLSVFYILSVRKLTEVTPNRVMLKIFEGGLSPNENAN